MGVRRAAARGSPGQADPPDSREDEILAAAATIFRVKGYTATTVLDIANAVGMLKGSLYYYIESKEDLLFRVILRAHETSLASTKEMVEGTSDLEGVRIFIRESIRFVTSHPEQAAAFHTEYRYLTGAHLAAIVALRDENEGILRSLIRQGQHEGTIRRDVDAQLMVLQIIGAIRTIHSWYQRDNEWGDDAIAEGFARLSVDGIVVRSPGHDGHAAKSTGGAAS